MEPESTSNSITRRIERIITYLPELREGQLIWVERIVLQFRRPKEFWVNPMSGLITECFLQDFGDALRLHHCFSDDAFAKDKFEYTAVRVWQQCGVVAAMAPRGNPGHDISVAGERISLKTQADRNLRLTEIRLHKFMELGKGNWTDKPADLMLLRDQFMRHLTGYDRILVLRNTSNPAPASPYWCYELVEIPVALFEQAAQGELEMMTDSKQMPKPGYCRVTTPDGQLAFRLYFDGGTERKLQVHKIRKELCFVHAEWRFIIKELDEA
ncbi:hypothetical protein A0257_05345 [Hymenobacter psoromatis]|nr:hypothetical protein A0257_05345 [Hymenobacter psoromatis]